MRSMRGVRLLRRAAPRNDRNRRTEKEERTLREGPFEREEVELPRRAWGCVAYLMRIGTLQLLRFPDRSDDRLLKRRFPSPFRIFQPQTATRPFERETAHPALVGP